MICGISYDGGYQEYMVAPWEAVARIPDALSPIEVGAFSMLSGRRIQGWPSGSSADSEDKMQFSALTGVRPRTETFDLEQANEAFAKVMENAVRFRAVLTTAGS